jgi:hypothetical protein
MVLARWLWFLATELSGALASAARHWVDKVWIDRIFARPHRELAGTPLQKMTAALARRDFLAARAWSIEDKKARAELQRRRDLYGFGDNDQLTPQ